MTACKRTEDEECLLALFVCGALPKEEMTHRTHIRLAWLVLRDYGEFEDLASGFCGLLRNYTQVIGQPEKYHATITWAYLVIIHERMQVISVGDFEWFAFNNEDLFKKDFLLSYYDQATLDSPLAKKVFVLPKKGAVR